MRACPCSEPAEVFAGAAWHLTGRLYQRVEADIGDEYVEIEIAIEVPHRESHPRADLVYAQGARHRGESDSRSV